MWAGDLSEPWDPETLGCVEHAFQDLEMFEEHKKVIRARATEAMKKYLHSVRPRSARSKAEIEATYRDMTNLFDDEEPEDVETAS